MNETRRVKQQVQNVVESFFATEEEGDRVHTLTLVHSLSANSKDKLSTALQGAPGVKKVHVDTESKRVQVWSAGDIEPLIDAAQAAGFRVERAY